MIVESCESCIFFVPETTVEVLDTRNQRPHIGPMDSPVVDDDKLHHTSADGSINTGSNTAGEVYEAFKSCKGRLGLTPFGRFPCHVLIELVQNEVAVNDQKFGFADEVPRKSRFTRFSRAYWKFSNSFRRD